MQMCHSLRRKQSDMSTVNQLISTFPNNEERLIRESFKQCLSRQHMHMYKQSQSWWKDLRCDYAYGH